MERPVSVVFGNPAMLPAAETSGLREELRRLVFEAIDAADGAQLIDVSHNYGDDVHTQVFMAVQAGDIDGAVRALRSVADAAA